MKRRLCSRGAGGSRRGVLGAGGRGAPPPSALLPRASPVAPCACSPALPFPSGHAPSAAESRLAGAGSRGSMSKVRQQRSCLHLAGAVARRLTQPRILPEPGLWLRGLLPLAGAMALALLPWRAQSLRRLEKLRQRVIA